MPAKRPAPNRFDRDEGGPPLPYDSAAAIRLIKRRDRQLGAIMRQVGPYRLNLKRPRSTFDTLAESIVYQQLHGKAAATIHRRLITQVGKAGRVRPKHVLASSEEQLRAPGLSRNKALAVRDLAERCRARQIPSLSKLATLSDEAILDSLTQVRGIGPWTVHMLLIFQLGRPDVLPLADLGLRKGFARTYDMPELPSKAQFAEQAERWRPYRSVACWYLWRATEL